MPLTDFEKMQLCVITAGMCESVIIAHNAEDLEFILKRLNKAYKEGGLTINFNKIEFIAITDQEFHINIEENVTIKQAQNFRYLGVNLNKKGINSKDIVNELIMVG